MLAQTAFHCMPPQNAATVLEHSSAACTALLLLDTPKYWVTTFVTGTMLSRCVARRSMRAVFESALCCCNCCGCARARSSAMNKRLCWYAVWTTDKAHPISATSNTILRRLINSDSFLSQLLGAAHHGRTRAHVRFAFSIARADARPQLKRGRWLCGRAQRQITQRSAGLRRARMGLHKAFDNSVFK